MSLSKATGMPRSNRQACASDMISALPDELLHHVMSFLTPREAVQTCLLSRRWRNVWVSSRCLNIDLAQFNSMTDLKTFVDNMLVDRGCTPLDTFWLRIISHHYYSDYLSDYSQIRPWVCHALRSNTQVLGVVHDGEMFAITSAFTSSKLKRLHLFNFHVDDWFVKKLCSGCPKLEELELISCYVPVTTFSSTTLKRLTITAPDVRREYAMKYKDLEIDMPNLVSLHIKEPHNRNPYLVNVSSLETASIYIDGSSIENLGVDCNVLSALSNATSLESLSLTVHDDIAMKVLARDALRCGTFSNLTTLSLGEWCLSTGCSVLLHLLRCSPGIEELILNLTDYGASHYDHPEQHTAAERDPACNEAKTPVNCENLKKIEINCPLGDKRVQVIVGILFSNIVSTPEINIKPSKGRHVRRYPATMVGPIYGLELLIPRRFCALSSLQQYL